MKRTNLITLSILVLLFSAALIAQANLGANTIKKGEISFDSKNHTYHPTSSIPYLSQPIEQKYMTIKSINAYESSLEKNILNKPF